MQNYYENRSPQKKREMAKLKDKGQLAEYPFFSVIDIDLRYSWIAETAACFATVKIT